MLLNKGNFPERAGSRALPKINAPTEPALKLQDVRARRKRKRDTLPLRREMDAFAEEEDIGDTIVVGGVLANPLFKTVENELDEVRPLRRTRRHS